MRFSNMDREEAGIAIKRSGACGVVVIVLTSVVAFMSLRGNSVLGISFGKEIFLDIYVFLILTIGVYRKSRVCAVLLFAYFILGKVSLFIRVRQVAALGASLPWIFCFFQGMRGAFSYHRIIQEEKEIEAGKRLRLASQGFAVDKPEPVVRDKRKSWFIAVFLAAIFIALLIYSQYDKVGDLNAIIGTSVFKDDTTKKTLEDRIQGKTMEEVEEILGKHIAEDATGGAFIYRKYKAEGKVIGVYFDNGVVIGVTD